MYILALIFILLTSFACESPFTTREPEKPETNYSNYSNPSSPQIVFINMQNAIIERNSENYIRSFIDSTRSAKRFEFIPDQAVAAAQPGTFDFWSLEDERQYLVQMFQATPADSTIRLVFDTVERTETSDNATFIQNYALVVRHSRQTSGMGAEMLGQANFFLERNETGDWAIYRWEDFKTNNDQLSWTELKAFFQ